MCVEIVTIIPTLLSVLSAVAMETSVLNVRRVSDYQHKEKMLECA